MSSLNVRHSRETDAGAWDAFVKAAPGGSFNLLHGWLTINARNLGHESIGLIAEDGAGIRGVLPLVFVRSRLFGRILCSMPFLNYGGTCAADDAADAALVTAALNEARQRGADYLELRATRKLPMSEEPSTRKISMTLKLDANPDTVWDKFASKHRTNIRRAFKNDLSVVDGGVELVPTFYSLLERSWHSLGTPLYSRDFFEAVARTFPEETRIFVCRRGAEPIAAAFNGYSNGVVEGMWAGGGPLARPLNANMALYWEMIKHACLRGMSHYHLGRSTSESGAEDYKKKWNAEATQLYWYFHRPGGGPQPALNVDNPKYRLAIAAWKKLPLPVVRLLGPPIARLIP